MSRRRKHGRNRDTTRRARLVQEALTEDPAFEDPAYMWCLQQVKELWTRALGAAEDGPGRFERANLLLIDMVAKRARKVRDA